MDYSFVIFGIFKYLFDVNMLFSPIELSKRKLSQRSRDLCIRKKGNMTKCVNIASLSKIIGYLGKHCMP